MLRSWRIRIQDVCGSEDSSREEEAMEKLAVISSGLSLRERMDYLPRNPR